MVSGSMARDGGNLILSTEEAKELAIQHTTARPLLRKLVGSQELVHYRNRQCLWIEDELLQLAVTIPEVAARIENVRSFRKNSTAKTTKGYAAIAHKFAQRAHKGSISIGVARHFSEAREYLPADIFDAGTVISDAALAICNPSMWELAIILSKLHLIWIATVCGKLKSDFRYSNTLGWNTFPLPTLTDKNKTDLTRCTEDILSAREAHFPATIADLYDPEMMPDNLREAHERNDEVLERIYIGRRFRNDTERLEKLFELYTKMSAGQDTTKKRKGETSA